MRPLRINKVNVRSISSSVELISAIPTDNTLEILKLMAPGILPLTAVGFYTLAVNRQIELLERAFRNDNKVMREFNELQVHENDKKIAALNESTKTQIDATKELVNAIERSTKESIKASEARIDSILMKFMVQNKQIDNEKK